MLALLASSPLARQLEPLLAPSAASTIAAGQVYVQRDWLPPELVRSLREDAEQLHVNGMFSADGLTNNAKSRDEQGFTTENDRQVSRRRGGASRRADRIDSSSR